MSPTYSYYCENCKVQRDEFLTMSARPDFMNCSICGQPAKQQIGAGQGFHLKGHGWSFDRYAGKSNFHFPGEKKDD